jgi:hypothetical protein
MVRGKRDKKRGKEEGVENEGGRRRRRRLACVRYREKEGGQEEN